MAYRTGDPVSVKGGDYVLLASVYRETDEAGVRRRRKRGDVLTLTAEQAERLLAAGAVAKKSDDEADVAVEHPGAELAVSPEVPELTAVDVARANSGLAPDDATGGVLSEEQARDLTAGGTTRPPKSATVAVWRKWAVDSGKLTEEEAAAFDKGDLQALDEPASE